VTQMDDARKSESTRQGSRDDREPPAQAGDSEAAAGPKGSEREDAPASDRDAGKKERVLHTRVPAVLERELKRFAENLRVPVSNLVRTILEDALNVADVATVNVEERLKSAARTLEHEREKLKKRVRRDPLADVIAFQDITMAVPARCAKCDREIARGARAHLGLFTEPRPPSTKIFVCDECLPH